MCHVLMGVVVSVVLVVGVVVCGIVVVGVVVGGGASVVRGSGVVVLVGSGGAVCRVDVKVLIVWCGCVSGCFFQLPFR